MHAGYAINRVSNALKFSIALTRIRMHTKIHTLCMRGYAYTQVSNPLVFHIIAVSCIRAHTQTHTDLA